MIDRKISLNNDAEQSSGVSFEYTAFVWCKYKKLLSQKQIAIVAPDQNLYWKQRDFATVAAYATSYANYANLHNIVCNIRCNIVCENRWNTHTHTHTQCFEKQNIDQTPERADLPNIGRRDDMLHESKLQKSVALANALTLKRCRSLISWNNYPQVSMTHQRFRLKVRENWWDYAYSKKRTHTKTSPWVVPKIQNQAFWARDRYMESIGVINW